MLQPHDVEGGRVPRRPRQGQEHHRLPFDTGTGRQPREAAQGVLHGQGGRGGRRDDRGAAEGARAGRHHHRRRQQSLPGHDSPHAVRRVEGPAVRRHRGFRRRGGGAQGPVDDAGRLACRVAVREADLPGHLREGRGRLAVLRLGRRERRGALREDGAQRHRVRRHAAHLRELPAHARPLGHVRRRDARGVQEVEHDRARQLPQRDHARHPRVQGHRRPAHRGEDSRHGRAEGHGQVDRHRGARRGRAAHAHRAASRR